MLVTCLKFIKPKRNLFFVHSHVIEFGRGPQVQFDRAQRVIFKLFRFERLHIFD